MEIEDQVEIIAERYEIEVDLVYKFYDIVKDENKVDRICKIVRGYLDELGK